MAVYKLSQQARNKLLDIYEYSLLNFGERQADTYYVALHNSFVHLANNPLMGRAVRAYRRHDHGQYAIFYVPFEDGVVVAQIFHHSENIDAKFS